MIELLIIHITIRKQHDVLNFKLIDNFFGSPTPPPPLFPYFNATQQIKYYNFLLPPPPSTWITLIIYCK